MLVTHPKNAVEVWQQRGIALLNAWEWLQTEEGQPKSLPHSWQVTSDSIAASVAIRWRAEGLMLLKSTEAPASFTNPNEADESIVDGYFHSLAPQLPQITWWNLRVEDK